MSTEEIHRFGDVRGENVVQKVVLDLADNFHELDDSGEDATFGEYARVEHAADNGTLTVLHETEPWGVQIKVTPIVGADPSDG